MPDHFEPPVKLYEGKFLRLVRRGRWEYAERTNTRGAAVIAGVTADAKLVLVEQPRASLGQPVIELPAGLVGDEAAHAGEGFAAAARREFREETGYEAREVTEVFRGVPSAGLSNEVITLFVATGLTKVSQSVGDGSERITLHEVPLGEIDAWLAERMSAGALVDDKVYAGLYFLLKRKMF